MKLAFSLQLIDKTSSFILQQADEIMRLYSTIDWQNTVIFCRPVSQNLQLIEKMSNFFVKKHKYGIQQKMAFLQPERVNFSR